MPSARAQLQRTARAIASPEGCLGGLAGRGRDHDTIDGDLLDAPRRRAEHEALADAALVHHLLVELADADAIGQEHAEQTAVGNRAAALDRNALRTLAGTDAALHTVPDDARPQATESIGWVTTREQVQGFAERLLRQVGEVRATANERVQLVDTPFVDGAGSNNVLREHVERVAGIAHLLDESFAHALHDDGGFEEIAAVLREDLARARFADLVAGAPDALETACHRPR